MKRVYVLLVNWNGWRDTIECLESVFRLNYPDYKVLVCDNASVDGSLEHIAAWADGEIPVDSQNAELSYLTTPPVPKPIPFLRIDANDQILLAACAEKLVLVQTGANLGFAGANNVGFRLGAAAGDLSYAWFLNNDTVVDPHALTAMVQRMDEHPGAGICGSTLRYYHDPQRVQACGGATYSRWTARIRHIGVGMHTRSSLNTENVERKMAYVIGASMLVSREFIETVGLMHEGYFLYYEELDWATRGAAQHFTLAYAPQSIVYHKEGASTGSRPLTSRQNLLADYYANRNRLAFTRKFAKHALPTVFLAVAFSTLRRAFTGRLSNAWILMHAVIDGLIPSRNKSAMIQETRRKTAPRAKES